LNGRLKENLLSIRQAALAAADPFTAVQRAIRFYPVGAEQTAGRLEVGGSRWQIEPRNRVWLIAAGKAAVRMAEAAAKALGQLLTGGVVVTKYHHSQGVELPSCLQIYEGGHPVPDERGMAGARAIEALLSGTNPQDRVILLVSGGASALLPLPVGGVALEDLQTLTNLLLRSGAAIEELNTIRKHLDRLKGGRLAQLAAPAPLAALILSDVIGDPLDVIASGPAVPDPTTYADAIAILARRGLIHACPKAILDCLQSGAAGEIAETPKPGDVLFDNVTNTLIGSNRLAARAAAQEAERLGYHTLILTTRLEGEACEVGKMAAALAKSLVFDGDPFPPPACLILGGETTVTVRGGGKGGRNQEIAAAAAGALDGVPGVAVMALATDGTDGPTGAAGGLVDGGSAEQARQAGYDLNRALAENDTYPWLEAAGGLMITGPTGTNVNDLLVVLAG